MRHGGFTLWLSLPGPQGVAWQSVQRLSARPSWSAGASGTGSILPGVWHIMHWSRPSSSWEIAVGVAVCIDASAA
jgi:hypothetical protein